MIGTEQIFLNYRSIACQLPFEFNNFNAALWQSLEGFSNFSRWKNHTMSEKIADFNSDFKLYRIIWPFFQ